MDAQSPSSSRMGSVSFVFFLLLPFPSLLLLLLLTFLAPPTPRSHFLFARQINPPPRRNPPSLTGTSRCPRVPSFSSFPSRLILALSRTPVVDRSTLWPVSRDENVRQDLERGVFHCCHGARWYCFHSLNMLFPESTVLGELYLGFAG